MFVLKNRFPWASQHRRAGTLTRKSLLVKAAGREVREGMSAHHVQTARLGAALAAQGLCHVPSEDGQVLREPAERGGEGLGRRQGHGCMNRWRTESPWSSGPWRGPELQAQLLPPASPGGAVLPAAPVPGHGRCHHLPLTMLRGASCYSI